MSRQDQINLLKRLLHYVETRTTAMADSALAQRRCRSTRTPSASPRNSGFCSASIRWSWALPRTGPRPARFSTDDHAGVPDPDRARDATANCAHSSTCAGIAAPRWRRAAARRALFSCPYHAWTYDLAGELMGIPDERCFPGVRGERRSLIELPLCEKHGLVWVIPTPAADGSTEFRHRSVARRARGRTRFVWLRVLVVLRPARDPRDHELEDRRRYLQRGLPHRLPAPASRSRDILHGNVTDFEAFGLNHRLTFPRKKLERLKAEPEDSWDLMWNTTLDLLAVSQHRSARAGRPRRARAHVSRRGTRRSRRDGPCALRAEGAEHRGRAHPLGQEHAARPRCRHRRGFPDRAQHSDRPDLGARRRTRSTAATKPAMIHYHQSMRTALGLRV